MNNFYIKPNIAIFDDDLELLNDLRELLSTKYTVHIFSNQNDMIDHITNCETRFNESCVSFIKSLKSLCEDEKLSAFKEIVNFPPVTVCLIDLNIDNSNSEGFLVSEKLSLLRTKKIIFTGDNDFKMATQMINKGISDAFINKSEDFIEDVFPCIDRLNHEFYSYCFNQFTLSLLERKDLISLSLETNGNYIRLSE